MSSYRLAGQEYSFPCPVFEFEPFEVESADGHSSSPSASDSLRADSPSPTLITQTDGHVGGAIRQVETWSAPTGLLLRVDGGSDFFISSDGQNIQRIGVESNEKDWPRLDREILAGPVLVLALALRGTWSIHASAVACNGRAILFLGESGQGKSTLAGYLAIKLPLVADDILPVTLTDARLACWPHFPQLKLATKAQPGASLPEQIAVHHICLLATADEILLQPLSSPEATQALLRHTAGTRLFSPDLLSKHLTFCSQAAGKIRLSRLTYPRRMDALPIVKVLIETLC